ncbi:MAG TPA: hypothetical protein VH230_05640 [Stellaceae bacterium]|nr:hypothetical protein [Stellaceae bacterium]
MRILTLFASVSAPFSGRRIKINENQFERSANFVSLHQSKSAGQLSAQHLNPKEDENGAGKKGQKCDAGQVALRWYGREFGIDQIQLVLNFVKIDAQKAIFCFLLWHAYGYARGTLLNR